jgi:hypothetical protein
MPGMSSNNDRLKEEGLMRKQFLPVVLMLAITTILLMPCHAYEALRGPTGLLQFNKEKAFDGYTLISPMTSRTSYLIDMEGYIVHKWDTDYIPGLYGELLPNGNLLRAGRPKGAPIAFGGTGGIIQEIDWNGKVVWEYKELTPTAVQHHCFHRMPNGNTLVLGWEYKSYEEAVAKGRDPKTLPKEGYTYDKIVHKGIWPDYVKEVNRDGKVVWEWHVWDHLGKGPDKLDINFILPNEHAIHYMANTDWTHFNTVGYIPEKDQVILNSRNFGEFYLIDKKTGKIVYRWGNPCAYGAGKCPTFLEDGDQQVFGPHHSVYLPNGNFMVFDNGWYRPERNRSRAIEMDPKTGKIVWQWQANIANSFYSEYQGATQRLTNGNTLITSSGQGHLIEVTGGAKPEVVWEYVIPVVGFEKDGRPTAKCFIDDKMELRSTDTQTLANVIHRAYRYPKDYPAFTGKNLSNRRPFREDCPVMWKIWQEQK